MIKLLSELIKVILEVNKIGKIIIDYKFMLWVVLVVEIFNILILVVVLKFKLNKKLIGYIC